MKLVNSKFKIQNSKLKNLIYWVVLMTLACNRSPVGFDELDRNLTEPVNFELMPNASACYEKYVRNGISSNLILGKNQEYEARVLLMFPLADSALDSLVSVRLVLKTRRHKNLPFTVHIVQQAWQENGVTWLRNDSLSYWLNPGADYSTTIIGQGSIGTDSTIIMLSYIDSLVHGNGIILLPQDTGFAILYSCETSNDPKIIYKYPKKERTFIASADASIIDTNNLRREKNNLWIGAGYAYHTYLKFAIDTLPDTATITDAQLILYPNKSFFLTDTVEIGVHRLLAPYQEGLTPKFYPNLSAKTRITNVDTLIKINLKDLVQFWSMHRDSNFGFVLNGQPEYSDIFRIELKTDAGNYPRLKFGYILPPKGKF